MFKIRALQAALHFVVAPHASERIWSTWVCASGSRAPPPATEFRPTSASSPSADAAAAISEERLSSTIYPLAACGTTESSICVFCGSPQVHEKAVLSLNSDAGCADGTVERNCDQPRTQTVRERISPTCVPQGWAAPGSTVNCFFVRRTALSPRACCRTRASAGV